MKKKKEEKRKREKMGRILDRAPKTRSSSWIFALRKNDTRVIEIRNAVAFLVGARENRRNNIYIFIVGRASVTRVQHVRGRSWILFYRVARDHPRVAFLIGFPMTRCSFLEKRKRESSSR